MTGQQFGDAYQNGGYRRTIRCLQARGAGEDWASELAEAAWTKGWERIGQLRDEKALVEWINSIAYRLFLTGLRDNRIVDFVQINHEPAAPQSMNLTVLEVRQALAKCTPRHQRLLFAFHCEGNSTHELAEQSGRSLEAIHAELYRARKEFREHMQGTRRHVSRHKRVLRMTVQKEDFVQPDRMTAA